MADPNADFSGNTGSNTDANAIFAAIDFSVDSDKDTGGVIPYDTTEASERSSSSGNGASSASGGGFNDSEGVSGWQSGISSHF